MTKQKFKLSEWLDLILVAPIILISIGALGLFDVENTLESIGISTTTLAIILLLGMVGIGMVLSRIFRLKKNRAIRIVSLAVIIIGTYTALIGLSFLVILLGGALSGLGFIFIIPIFLGWWLDRKFFAKKRKK